MTMSQALSTEWVHLAVMYDGVPKLESIAVCSVFTPTKATVRTLWIIARLSVAEASAFAVVVDDVV